MPKIVEIIVEPSKIEIDSTFKLKIKVKDEYLNKQILKSEDNLILITENGEKIRSEWGE